MTFVFYFKMLHFLVFIKRQRMGFTSLGYFLWNSPAWALMLKVKKIYIFFEYSQSCSNICVIPRCEALREDLLCVMKSRAESWLNFFKEKIIYHGNPVPRFTLRHNTWQVIQFAL
jgi:hypothetical protein